MAQRKNKKTKKQITKRKSPVVVRQVGITPKRFSIAVMVIFALLFAFVGIKMLFPSRAATSFGIGANFHCAWQMYSDAQRQQILDKMAASGINTVRIDLGWDSLQYNTNNPNVFYQWSLNQADYCVDQARARGMKVLLEVDHTAQWANGGQGRAVPPYDLNNYAIMMGLMADHFKGRVAGWEVWNEPDASGFWTGGASTYVNMLKLTYPKIKAADPNTKVVLGAPVYQNDGWISQIYAQGGKNSFDVLATHPYQGISNTAPDAPDPDNSIYWLTHFPAVLNVMRQYGDGAKEVWFTEFGWSTHSDIGGEQNHQHGVTEAQQADYTVRAFRYVMANYPNVTAMFAYTDRDLDPNVRQSDDLRQDTQLKNYGLVHYYDLSPKPVLASIKSFVDSLNTPPPDTLAPSAQITNPTNGALVSGTVNVTASASDNVGVTKVNFYVNGGLVSTDTSAPYSFSWNTSSLANGTYSLVAKAYDAAGNVGTSATVSANVNNTVAPPTVTVNNLSASGTFSKNSAVNVSATLQTSSAFSVNNLIVAMRDQDDKNWDINLKSPATLSGTQTFTGISEVLPVGTYRYFVAYNADGQWKELAPTKTFTIISGNGLNATYYNNKDLTGTTVSRTDGYINFQWGNNAPVSGIDADTFSVRWAGKVMVPKSENYTFTTNSDDGIRLWVNNKLVVDDWSDHSGRKKSSAPVTLSAGVKYDIKVEFYDNTLTATAQLYWSSPSVSQQIIPQLYLYKS